MDRPAFDHALNLLGPFMVVFMGAVAMFIAVCVAADILTQ